MEREEVLRICEVRGKTLLDIGAGPLSTIAGKEFNCTVTCIDIEENALKMQRREVRNEGLEGRISLELADASDLPHSDNSFDVVISYGALHHTPLERRERFLLESFRAATDRLCIVEYREDTFPHDEKEFRRVDLDWLECRLSGMGRTEKQCGKDMDAYICFKEKH